MKNKIISTVIISLLVSDTAFFPMQANCFQPQNAREMLSPSLQVKAPSLMNSFLIAKENPFISAPTPDLLPLENIGKMPAAFDKSKLNEGKITIAYNPDSGLDLFHLLKGKQKMFIHYAYNGNWKTHKHLRMTKKNGIWYITLDDIDIKNHYKLEFAFSDEPEDAKHANWDSAVSKPDGSPTNYKTYLFWDFEKNKPVFLYDSHTHLNLNKDVDGKPENDHIDNLISPLLSGGVDKAVVISREKEDLIKLLEDFPQFRAFFWVTPDNRYGRKKTDISELISFLEQNPKIAGIKLHPNVDGEYINSKATKEYLHALKTLSKRTGRRYAVLVHSTEPNEDGSDDKGRPADIGLVAEEFPEIDFILGHIDFKNAGNNTEAMKIAKRLDNVYLETSWVNGWGAIIQAIEIAGKQKVLFGSDAGKYKEHFHYTFLNYGSHIESLFEKLPFGSFRNFIFENSLRLFDLREKNYIPLELIETSI